MIYRFALYGAYVGLLMCLTALFVMMSKHNESAGVYWTGVGIGIAGLIILIPSATINISYEEERKRKRDEEEEVRQKTERWKNGEPK